MSFFTKFFGGENEPTNGDAIYRNGDKIPCESCHQTLKVKYFAPGKVIVGGPTAIKGIALVCQHCSFITCIDCAMKPMGSVIQSCPSCKKPLGPTTFTEGIDIPKKQVPQSTSLNSRRESPIPQATVLPERSVPTAAPISQKDLLFSCPHCGQSIACDPSGAGLETQCPTCQQRITIPSEARAAAPGRIRVSPQPGIGPKPASPTSRREEEEWTPINPQVSSRMPFNALEQIFIFTTGDGKSLFDSKLVTGMLQDAACKPLNAILGKIAVDVIAQSTVAEDVIRHGTIPDAAWTAMSTIKPVIAQDAQRGNIVRVSDHFLRRRTTSWLCFSSITIRRYN